MSRRKPQADKNRRTFGIVLAGIAMLGIALVAWQLLRPKSPDFAARTLDVSSANIVAEGHVLGSPTAPVEVLEFADFECPSCAQFATVTEPDVRKRLVETGQIRLRYFDLPLAMHRNSWPASHAAWCAGDQGKFWEMHDRLYAGQPDWDTHATGRPKKIFEGYARELGLDGARWEQCYDEEKFRPQIEAGLREAERRMVNSTPTFVFGRLLRPGNSGYDQFKARVDSARAPEMQQP